MMLMSKNAIGKFNINESNQLALFIWLGLLFCLCCGKSSYASMIQKPIMINNCGKIYHFTDIPKRVIVYRNPAIENMLALGLEQHLLGVIEEKGDNDILTPWDNAKNSLHFLSHNGPLSEEALLDSEPDFIYSSGHYWFYSKETATREILTQNNISTYLSETECFGQRSKNTKMVTFESIFDEIRTIGRIFNISQRADVLINQLQMQLTMLQKTISTLPEQKILWWYSGTDIPFVAGCCGVPGMFTKIVDGENIYADSPELWPMGSWELIAVRDPDVIVLGNLYRGGKGDSATDKIKFIENHPVASAMKAVRNKHYIILPGHDMDPSARSVYALERFVIALKQLKDKENLKNDKTFIH